MLLGTGVLVLGAGDDGDLGILRLTGEVLRVGAVGHVAVVEELLGDPGIRGIVLGGGGQRVGGDDTVLVDVRQLRGDLLGSSGLGRRLGGGLRGGGGLLSRSAFLTFLAGCLLALAARGVLGRLGRLLGGIRVGLGLGLGGRLISGRLGGLAGGVLTGDVLGGLLGAARQDTKDRPEVHDSGGAHQFQGRLAGLSRQGHYDILPALAGDLSLGDAGGVHTLADHLNGLLDIVVTDRRAVGGRRRQDDLGTAFEVKSQARRQRRLVPHGSRHESTETDDDDEDEHQEAAPWPLSLLAGHVVPSWGGVGSGA